MSGSTHVPLIEKLKGSDDYQNWKFACKAYLKGEGLWKCIEGDPTAVANEDKMAKAIQKIVMSVDKSFFVHIRDATTPKEMWDKLQEVCEDKGVNNQMRLIKRLINTKLEDFSSTEEYIEQVTSLSQQLTNMGFIVSEEWVGTLLLLGLPDKYEPMVMGLQASGTPITGIAMRAKLLASVTVDSKPGSFQNNNNNESAFVSSRFKQNFYKRSNYSGKYNKNKMQNKKHMRCYKCNRFGHLAKECRSSGKPSGQSNIAKDSDNDSEGASAWMLASFAAKEVNSYDWFIDSGATQHMTPQKDLFINYVRITNRTIKVADNNKITPSEKATSIWNLKLQMKIRHY